MLCNLPQARQEDVDEEISATASFEENAKGGPGSENIPRQAVLSMSGPLILEYAQDDRLTSPERRSANYRFHGIGEIHQDDGTYLSAGGHVADLVDVYWLATA